MIKKIMYTPLKPGEWGGGGGGVNPNCTRLTWVRRGGLNFMCLFACNVFCSIDVIDMRKSLNLMFQ